MKKMTLLAVLVMSLVVSAGKAHAFNAEKFGPVLHDPMPIDGREIGSSKDMGKFCF